MLDLIENSTLMWLGWIVAFSIGSSAATWLITSWSGSGKALKNDIQELRRDLRSETQKLRAESQELRREFRAETQELARGLSALGETVGDVRERVARIEAFMNTIDWDGHGDLRGRS